MKTQTQELYAQYGIPYKCPYSDPNDYKPFSQMEWRAAEYVTAYSDLEYNTLDTSRIAGYND